MDCSFNGDCETATGDCSCHFGWTGYHCGQLKLDKAAKGAGYVRINNISTWGGTVIADAADSNEQTKYHMVCIRIL